MASLEQLAAWSRARVSGVSGGWAAKGDAGDRGDNAITRVSAIETADPQSCVFATGSEALSAALGSPAGAILASSALADAVAGADRRVLWVEDARYGFAVVARKLLPERGESSIHPSASVADEATIGRRTVIEAGACIAPGVRLGEACTLGPRVVIHAGTTLGDRVVVQAGAVLGSDGFGYVRDPESGAYLAFPQQGTLVIEDDVEIGANSTIDRGALGETRIGRGTKIDNLVHIGHNCCIGEDVVIAAQAGIAGSSALGRGAVLGGQVGIADHVTIGPGVILGAQAGVPSGKRLSGAGQVFWGTPARPIEQYLRDLASVRRRARPATN